MKTKILSLAIALMMLVSVVTAMPVGAIVYENNDIILDVMDLTASDFSDSANTTVNANATPASEGTPSWATEGSIRLTGSSGQYVTFTFNVAKAGTYKVTAATSCDLTNNATMTATLLGDPNEVICKERYVGKSDADPAAVRETSLNYVTLTEGEHSLKIARHSYAFYLWNVKLEFVSDEIYIGGYSNSSPANPVTTFSAAMKNRVPADDCGWMPVGAYPVLYKYASNTYTTMTNSTVKVLKDGYYDIYLGAEKYNSAVTPGVTVKVDGTTVATRAKYNAGDTSSETKVVDKVFLTAGTTHTINLSFRSNSSSTTNYSYVYGFKVVYHPLTDEELTVVSSVEDATISGIAAPTQASTPTNDYGWIPSKFTLLAKTSTVATTATHTVNIMSDGYYDMYLGLENGTDSSTVDIYVDEEVNVGDFATSDMEEDVTTQLVAGPIYLTRGEHTIKIAAKTGSVWYYGFKLSPAAQGGTDEPGDDVVEGITLVKNDGSAFTSNDIASGASVKANAVITMDDAASAYIIIAQYTDNTATKQMIGTIVMDTVSLTIGDNDVTSTNALTLDADCNYVKAFLWTADGNYEPLLAETSVSQ